MNKILIYEYINRLKREDIVKFCNIKGINVTENEIDVVYDYIKNDYKRFFNSPNIVLEEVKSKVSDNAYRIIMELYEKYQKFI